MDTDAYISSLLATDLLRKPTIRAAIKALQLSAGGRGLDAGCGIGLQSLLLAEAVGSVGHITGIDVTREFLDHGEELVKASGLSERISFKEGNVANLPFDDNYFDWAWSSDCVGYGPWDPLPLLQELARVVKSGGTVALAAWSSEKFLPGYPLLEARLGAMSAGLAPFEPGKDPNKHFLCALGWFRKLGFKEPKAEVFSDCICAPADDEMRNALLDLFKQRWGDVESELEPEDRAEFQRLCKPESPDFILDNPDYYGFFTYSMFWGKVPG